MAITKAFQSKRVPDGGTPFCKDPLVKYLEPLFGDSAYDTNFWTPALRDTVEGWLACEATDDLYAAILAELEDVQIEGCTREDQARFIVSKYDPWSVVDATRWAAVKMAPDLESLVLAFDGFADYEQVGYWLAANATKQQLAALIRVLYPDKQAILPKHFNKVDKNYLMLWIDLQLPEPRPRALLAAWRSVITPDSVSVEAVPNTLRSEVIRAWAKKHGYPVGSRGRLPRQVVSAYKATSVDRSRWRA